MTALSEMLKDWPEVQNAIGHDGVACFSVRGSTLVMGPSELVGRHQDHFDELAVARAQIETRLQRWFASPALRRLARAEAQETLADQARILGISVRDLLPGLQYQLDAWREANVALIRTAAIEGYHAQVSDAVEQAHASGLRVEELQAQLEERWGVSSSRAELIARDQTLKLNGALVKESQTRNGITHYTWSTSNDERVREAHQELNGTEHAWDSPPEVSDDGRREHPGGDYQCRCQAIPVL